jgi:hypothetical protein
MLISADQLLAHAVGDYILQSHRMATEKTKHSIAAALHAVTYGLPFLLLTTSPAALAIIIGTHFVIDRWRLARFVCWAKNWPWQKKVTATGYPDDVPAWLSIWLMIAADNIMHITINGAALRCLT